MEDQLQDFDPASPSIRIELEGFLKHEKELRNLQLQESRLRCRREKDVTELRTAISQREARRAHELNQAAQLYLAAQQKDQPFELAGHGFDFRSTM